MKIVITESFTHILDNIDFSCEDELIKNILKTLFPDKIRKDIVTCFVYGDSSDKEINLSEENILKAYKIIKQTESDDIISKDELVRIFELLFIHIFDSITIRVSGSNEIFKDITRELVWRTEPVRENDKLAKYDVIGYDNGIPVVQLSSCKILNLKKDKYDITQGDDIMGSFVVWKKV